MSNKQELRALIKTLSKDDRQYLFMLLLGVAYKDIMEELENE